MPDNSLLHTDATAKAGGLTVNNPVQGIVSASPLLQRLKKCMTAMRGRNLH